MTHDPATVAAAAERLRAFIRLHASGGCKMLSQGYGCTCPPAVADAEKLLATGGE